MAHLAIVGGHSTNGVAEIHSHPLRTTVLKDFADMVPARFNNKTNGVTPRRWLLLANPDLSKLITETIGEGWVVDLAELEQLLPYADDPAFISFLRWQGGARLPSGQAHRQADQRRGGRHRC